MIPEKFKEKMKYVLGDEYPAFIEALENSPPVRGMRANLIKTTPEKLVGDGVFIGRIHIFKASAHHLVNYLLHGQILCSVRGYILSVAHYGHLVGYTQYFIHFMRDVYDSAVFALVVAETEFR